MRAGGPGGGGGGFLFGEHVQGPRPPVLNQGLQNRDVVAQRLATSRGCGDHHILARQDRIHRLGLVREHLVDAPCCKGGLHWL